MNDVYHGDTDTPVTIAEQLKRAQAEYAVAIYGYDAKLIAALRRKVNYLRATLELNDRKDKK